ncbi:MAG: hypothetical protein CAF43_008590 [Nitrospira sp. CG24C]|nr:MAG: hypothetical protein CAF43_008590 [Nitrospira sp. CG24C]
MTVTNPDLSRTESAQLRPLLVSVYAHVILGYSLYFVALWQTAPPLWALDYIEQLKPTLGALETAARLSERPFSAQVMILYTVLSSLLLGMYWVYYMFFVNHLFQEAYRGMCEKWQQTGIPVKERLKVRLKVGASGVILLYTFGYELPISYFVEGGDRYRDYLNNWVSSAMFSSSILSTTVLLLVSMTMSMAIVYVPLSIYLSIVPVHPPHQ